MPDENDFWKVIDVADDFESNSSILTYGKQIGDSVLLCREVQTISNMASSMFLIPDACLVQHDDKYWRVKSTLQKEKTKIETPVDMPHRKFLNED